MRHKLKGSYSREREVWLDGKWLSPELSQEYHNHSPDGFNWGYEGSGPAQLALAIMLELTGKATGYQDFKRNVIARLPQGKDFDVEFELPPYEEETTECDGCGGVKDTTAIEGCVSCKSTEAKTNNNKQRLEGKDGK